MRILRSNQFDKELKSILFHISKDSPYQARHFKNRLQKKVQKLPFMPYKFRQSFYHDNPNIRDMIFFGYTIPYLVDTEKDVVILLEIFKWVDR